MNNLVEENGQGKKVVIGLSGGISSFIAAYLLKIQKYELIGVTVLQKINPETRCSLSAEDLQGIRDFCHRLKIRHITIDADDVFYDQVQDRWIADRIEVKPWSPSCFSCHKMRMNILYQEMIKLGADFISTGHFAKTFQNNGVVTVHSVHDLSLDQSLILQNLDQKILSALLLPLSSLGSAEIEKLTKNFSLSPFKKDEINCFEGPFSDELLNRFQAFKVSGEVLTSHGERLGTHSGTFNMNPGKEVLFTGHKYIVSHKIAGSSNILVEKESYFSRRIKLNQVIWARGEEVCSPFFAYLNVKQTSFKVKVYPKTLKTAVIEFPEGIKLLEHQKLALYKKKGGNSKLILSGEVEFLEENPSEQDLLEFVF